MEIIEVKTNQIISDMRNSKLELTADYIQAMSDHITALEAEAGRVRAEALREGATAMHRTVLKVCSTDSLERIKGLSIDLVVAASLLNAAASQPETKAEALTFENLNESTT